MVLTDEKREEIAEALFYQQKNRKVETAWGMQLMLIMFVGDEETERVLDLVKRKFVEAEETR